LYGRLDSIYSDLLKATDLRLRTGDVAKLDKIAAEARLREIQAFVEQNKKDMVAQQQQLMVLLNQNDWLLPVTRSLEKLSINVSENGSLHPLLKLQQQNIDIASSNITVQKNTNKPDFSGRFFSQRVWAAKDPFTGFSVSAAIPLFGTGANRSKVKVAEAEREVAEKSLAYQTQQLQTQKASALTTIEKNQALVSFYESTGLRQAEEIIKAAGLSYRAGEISFAELSQFLSQAIGIRQSYLDVLNEYNQSVIQFNYYNNQ
jgi:cobalt-zinc-cadmium resistance protein CzcA